MPSPSRRKNQSGGGGAYSFELLGLKELQKALRAADKECKQAIAKRLRVIGNEVRDSIRAKAPKKSGNLKRSVRTRVSRLQVRVVSDARAPDSKSFKGYRYGKRLEFDPAYGGRFAWFYPTWEAMKSEASKKFEQVLEDVVNAFSRGGT